MICMSIGLYKAKDHHACGVKQEPKVEYLWVL